MRIVCWQRQMVDRQNVHVRAKLLALVLDVVYDLCTVVLNCFGATQGAHRLANTQYAYALVTANVCIMSCDGLNQAGM